MPENSEMERVLPFAGRRMRSWHAAGAAHTRYSYARDFIGLRMRARHIFAIAYVDMRPPYLHH